MIALSDLQTQEILNGRLREELNISLSISVYDVDRNETARQHRQELVSVRYCHMLSIVEVPLQILCR